MDAKEITLLFDTPRLSRTFQHSKILFPERSFKKGQTITIGPTVKMTYGNTIQSVCPVISGRYPDRYFVLEADLKESQERPRGLSMA